MQLHIQLPVIMQHHNGLSPYRGQDLLDSWLYLLTVINTLTKLFSLQSRQCQCAFLKKGIKQHNSVYFIMFSCLIFWSLLYLSPPPSQSRHTVALKNGVVLFCGCQLFSPFINFDFTYSYFEYDWSTSLDSQNKISFFFCTYVCIVNSCGYRDSHQQNKQVNMLCDPGSAKTYAKWDCGCAKC